MSKKNKKAATVETQAPVEGQNPTPTPVPLPEPVKLTFAQSIESAISSMDDTDQRKALRKAIESTRPDIVATTSTGADNATLPNVRYGSGRAFKQRPSENEAVLFANARRLTLGLLNKLDASEALAETLKATIAGLGTELATAKAEAAEGQAKLAADFNAMIAERDIAKIGAETAKAELSKVAGELAVVKAELEAQREPGGNTASGLPVDANGLPVEELASAKVTA